MILMAIGDSGRAVKTTVPGQGPKEAADRVGRHVRGSGTMPGTGATAGETPQANKRATPGDPDNDGM